MVVTGVTLVEKPRRLPETMAEAAMDQVFADIAGEQGEQQHQPLQCLHLVQPGRREQHGGHTDCGDPERMQRAGIARQDAGAVAFTKAGNTVCRQHGDGIGNRSMLAV